MMSTQYLEQIHNPRSKRDPYIAESAAAFSSTPQLRPRLAKPSSFPSLYKLTGRGRYPFSWGQDSQFKKADGTEHDDP